MQTAICGISHSSFLLNITIAEAKNSMGQAKIFGNFRCHAHSKDNLRSCNTFLLW